MSRKKDWPWELAYLNTLKTPNTVNTQTPCEPPSLDLQLAFLLNIAACGGQCSVERAPETGKVGRVLVKPPAFGGRRLLEEHIREGRCFSPV